MNTKQPTTTKNDLKKGDKVRTIYGAIETVLRCDGAMVVTYESLNWYHPTKVWKV